MTKQDIITLSSTFVIGFSVGIYVYFAGFMPQFLAPSGDGATQYDVFTVVGEQYGGCARTGQCAAFQLLADGSFNFVLGNGRPTSGQLFRTHMRSLQAALQPSSLASAAQSVADNDCISYRDGVDYRYEITLDAQEYTVDTCTTALSDEPAVAEALDNVWNYFTMP